jgi:hypothetical protein
LILTDAIDRTIPEMSADKKQMKARTGGVPFVANATVPRLFDGKGDPNPADDHEQKLKAFASDFDGRFGPGPKAGGGGAGAGGGGNGAGGGAGGNPPSKPGGSKPTSEQDDG